MALVQQKKVEKYELPNPHIDVTKHFFTISFVRPDLQKKTIQERLEGVEKWEKVGRKLGEKLGENE